MNSDKNDSIAPDIRALIRKLSQNCVDEALFEEILTTLLLMADEHKDRGDYKLINKALKELRASFKIFKPYKEIRKVALFGSARVVESDRNYELAQTLAKSLVENGFMIISGAGGGIMEAANRGAGANNSFGLNIKLPHEQAANSFIRGSANLIEFKYFFTRKLVFIKESHATVLLPGGFGTIDEGFENLTLFQTGKCMPRPIVLLDHEEDDYWDRWLDLLDSLLLENGFASTEDRLLIKRARNAEEALNHIKSFYRVFHSLRYVREKTVLRLNTPISAELLEKLNGEFQDILLKGKIEPTGPLNDELKNQEYPTLPRISFYFDKKSFGRLNLLITRINQD
jgi:uncharacterized protein (TIGR00730 family)